jgi:polypyrimidine tract-binding protein 2
MCGTITKLVIFNKGGKDQALVQYERAADAAAAIDRFQGKNIYSGCNTLHIGYSNLPEITVKYNNDRSYDFTNPNLPSGEGQGDSLLSGDFDNLSNRIHHFR